MSIEPPNCAKFAAWFYDYMSGFEGDWSLVDPGTVVFLSYELCRIEFITLPNRDYLLLFLTLTWI